MATYVFRANQVRKLKEGTDERAYFLKHPDAYKVSHPPCLSTLNHWANEDHCKALDGCRVEPDGTCEHGKPSWLMALGYI